MHGSVQPSFWTLCTFCTENELTPLYMKENKCNRHLGGLAPSLSAARERDLEFGGGAGGWWWRGAMGSSLSETTSAPSCTRPTASEDEEAATLASGGRISILDGAGGARGHWRREAVVSIAHGVLQGREKESRIL